MGNILIGNKEISSGFVGTSDLDSIWLGNTQLWTGTAEPPYKMIHFTLADDSVAASSIISLRFGDDAMPNKGDINN